MKNLSVSLTCVIVAVLFFPLYSSAQTTPPITPAGNEFTGNPIQTAVPFLRISPDANSGAMGDTGIATTPDVNAVFWNAAKLPFSEDDAGVALSYTPWLAGLNVNDIHLINAGGFYKLDGMQALNFGVKYFSLGEAEFRQTQLDEAVIQNPQEFAIQAGYSRKLSETTGIGVNLKYIHSDLANGQSTGANQDVQVGQAVAGDLNVYFDPISTGTADWSFGAALSNLGSKVSYLANSSEKDFLPTNLGLGANVDFSVNDYSNFALALDVNKLLVPTPDGINDASFKDKSVINSIFSSWGDAPDGFSEEMKEFQTSLGAEYGYNDQFFGRAGYFYEHEDKGNRQYATIGAGVKYNTTNFNFAYLFSTNNSNSPLNKTLRFSLEFDINK